MKFQPLYDRVIIRKDITEKSGAGLILSEAAQQSIQLPRGRVIAVGPGKPSMMSGELTAMQVKIGDAVVYNPHAAVPVSSVHKDFIIMPEEGILAIVSGEEV